MTRHPTQLVGLCALNFGLLVATTARAGTYQQVTQSDWQQGVTGLPTYVNMYIYLPTTIATKPPIVVVPHHCQGTAASSHSEEAGLEKIADSTGFILIYPEATGQNCWDAGSSRSLKHGGGGDTGAVVQQVKYTLGKYNGDASRVYSVGGSSGGIMTEALLGVYPDIFMAGISIMGVPCGCWAVGYNDVVGKPSNGTGQWSGSCAGGSVTHTAQEWGDLVRSYFPGYTGHRPRLQHWHGTADTTLNYKNLAEDVKEWTNVLGLSATPTGTEQNTPKSGTTRQYWKNSCYTVYETFSLSGVGHSVSVDAAAIAAYFGVDKAGTPDPETAACGSGGASGAGGASSAGGAANAGGVANTGGQVSTGGNQNAGGTLATGGKAASGGVATNGGSQATGGKSTGGASATGGNSPNGGNTASGGGTITGGNAATGGNLGSGGNVATVGGSGASTGGAATGSGGSSTQATGGSVALGGSSVAVGGQVIGEPGAESGCSCSIPNTRSSSALLAFALGGLVFAQRRRRR